MTTAKVNCNGNYAHNGPCCRQSSHQCWQQPKRARSQIPRLLRCHPIRFLRFFARYRPQHHSMVNTARSTTLAACLSIYALGCGSSMTPTVPTGPHTDREQFVIVSRMPDIVQVQTLPQRPDDSALWIDGYWHWSGRHWVWRDGGWAYPPKGAYYAAPQLVRIPATGTRKSKDDVGVMLLYRPGHWHLADGSIAEVEFIDVSKAN